MSADRISMERPLTGSTLSPRSLPSLAYAPLKGPGLSLSGRPSDLISGPASAEDAPKAVAQLVALDRHGPTGVEVGANGINAASRVRGAHTARGSGLPSGRASRQRQRGTEERSGDSVGPTQRRRGKGSPKANGGNLDVFMGQQVAAPPLPPASVTAGAAVALAVVLLIVPALLPPLSAPPMWLMLLPVLVLVLLVGVAKSQATSNVATGAPLTTKLQEKQQQ